MRVLFVVRRPGNARYFEPVLELLAERGHSVVIACSRLKGKHGGPPDLERVELLLRRFPTLSFCEVPEPLDDELRGTALMLRALGDFGRFLEPRYGRAVAVRARLAYTLKNTLHPGRTGVRASKSLYRAIDSAAEKPRPVLARVLRHVSLAAEHALPANATLVGWLRELQPDVVLVSPLVDQASDQVEIVKAARTVGLPTAACIASWDNLSSKGTIRIIPDRVFVWNDIQRGEATEMHGVPPERVVATGAPRFDRWFAMRETRSRDVFLREVGLDVRRPYLAYVCSSEFIAALEVPFVERWAREIRASRDPRLEEIGILVRPHPFNAQQWVGVELGIENLVVWPPCGALVADGPSWADFFDTLVHASVVVGVNTSALIEAAIVSKEVCTLLDPEFERTQEGTVHYHYLRRGNGGFLHEASTMEEHLTQIATAVAGGGGAEGTTGTREFVARFVRPRGLHLSATEALVDAIEATGAVRPAPLRPPAGTAIARALLALIAFTRRVKRRRLSRLDSAGRLRRDTRVSAAEDELRAAAPSWKNAAMRGSED